MAFGMMDGYGYGMSSSMWILGAIFWILILAGLVLLIKYLWEGAGAKGAQESALDILKKRYAKGDGRYESAATASIITPSSPRQHALDFPV